MDRRTFLGRRACGTAAGLLVAPFIAEAQRAGKVPRIGFLSPGAPSDAGGNRSALAILFAAFEEGLRELGYVGGQNIAIESRWAEGHYNRLPGLAIPQSLLLRADQVIE